MRALFLTVVSFAALSASPALAQRDFLPRPQVDPAARTVNVPLQARISTVKAAEYVMTKICLPVAFERNTVDTLAPYFELAPANPIQAGAGPGEKAYHLKSLTDIYVIGAADGGCIVRTGNASAINLREAALGVLKTAPRPFEQIGDGVDAPARMSFSRHCAAGASPPVAVRIATTQPGYHTPYSLEVRFVRAEGAAGGACSP